MRSGRTRYRVVLGPLLMATLAWSWTAPASSEDHNDDFTAVRTITVHFADGNHDVSRSQRTELQQLAAQAQGLPGFMISIAASAPPAGSNPVDQKLSMQRASVVSVILRQAGVPLANLIIVPAVTSSSQVAPQSSKAHDYRTAVVTLLQNKGATGQ